MRLLLDTHVWLWLNSSPERLPPEMLRSIQAGDGDAYLSAASAWEVAIKWKSGRLELEAPPSRWVPQRISQNALTTVAIEPRHAATAGELPPHHGDPFDRMIVAQAQDLRIAIATIDTNIARYDVEVTPWR